MPGNADWLAEAAALTQQAFALYQHGRCAEAEPLCMRALAIREQALGPEHPDVARSLNNLAVIYEMQARCAEAEPLHKRALAIWEKALGPEHPYVAQSLNNLTELYHNQGRFAEAEPLCMRALAIREQALAPEHPDVAISLNILAGLYHVQGRYAEAEPFYRRALAIREKALGPDHPDVAISLNNLAELYRVQGHYAEAEAPHKRALAIREQALGPEHPDVATSLNSLAALYCAQGRYAEAEPLHKRALAIREKALGPDHPDVAISLNNLAELCRAQGHYAEAEAPHKRALAIRERALGPEHPDVATSLNNLTVLYHNQGRYAEAESFYRRALAVREKVVGADHPDVGTILNNLASLYQEQGRYAEAEPLYRRALKIHERALGPEHPDVGQSLNNLAMLYLAQARYAEAEPFYRRARAITEKALGADHPHVATSLNNLAVLYKAQGRYVEAEPLHRRALAIREGALGPEHPDIAQTLDNLAELYRTQSRYAEAEPLCMRALAIRERGLGPEHPDVGRSLNNLAMLHREQGRYVEALLASTRAVAIIFRHLSVSFGQRSGATDAERRADRVYFSNHVGIADQAAENEPDRRSAIALETFRVAQMAHVSTAGRAVAGMAARFAAGSDALAAVVREQQDLADRWRFLDAAIVRALSRMPTEHNSAEEAATRASFDDTARQLEALNTRIAAEFPDYAELSNPQPVPVDIVQGLLSPEEALLVYLCSQQDTWLWVVRRVGVFFIRTGIGAGSLAAEVAALRVLLDPELNRDLQAFPAGRAYALHQKILAPAAPVIADANHLIVVPDGPLQSLPLGVLVTEPPERDPKGQGEHRDIAWLARGHTVTVLPSVSSLWSLRQHAAVSGAGAPFLGIGDPVLQGCPRQERGANLANMFRGYLANVEKVRELQPLPETAKELRAIAQIMGATDDDLLLGERATEPMLRQTALDRYKVIAFATHGLVSGGLEGLAEPALVLTPPAEASPETDGLLTASKIATHKLDADWVVLSACNTAAGDGSPDAGGLTGLAKAFFYAGARSLLVSHWPVWSKATVALTTGAFAALAQESSIGRAEAFRRAMMAMLEPSKPACFAHPQVWAPFILVGEGGGSK